MADEDLYSYHRQIGEGVRAYKGGIKTPAIRDANRYAIRPLYYVVIGNHVASFIDDDTRAGLLSRNSLQEDIVADRSHDDGGHSRLHSRNYFCNGGQ